MYRPKQCKHQRRHRQNYDKQIMIGPSNTKMFPVTSHLTAVDI